MLYNTNVIPGLVGHERWPAPAEADEQGAVGRRPPAAACEPYTAVGDQDRDREQRRHRERDRRHLLMKCRIEHGDLRGPRKADLTGVDAAKIVRVV